MAEGTTPEKSISRRDFLRWVGTGVAAGVATSIASSAPQTESAEKIKNIPGPIQIDFAPNFDNEQLARSFLGDKYKSLGEIESESLTGMQYGEQFESWAVKNYPEAALFQTYLTRFKNHGTEVAQAIKEGDKLIGKSVEPVMIPLQNLIQPNAVIFLSDEWGNAGIAVNLEPQPIIDEIRKVRLNAPNQKVVNLSILIGRTEIWQSPLADPHPNRPGTFSLPNEDGTRAYFVDTGKADYTPHRSIWNHQRRRKGRQIYIRGQNRIFSKNGGTGFSGMGTTGCSLRPNY